MILPILSALAGPTRLVAARITQGGDKHCAGESMRRLDAMQGRMSRHLRALPAVVLNDEVTA